MLENLINIDISITLFLNGLHNNLFDIIFYYISNKFIWIPFYVFLIYLIYKKTESKKQFAVFLASVVLLIILTDQISVHLFKNVFERLRPCHNTDLINVLHTVKGKCGGQYGFVSSHATNVFGLAVLVLSLLKNKNFTIILLIWASIVSYSRIYLGVHYFGDVLAGALLGSLLAFVIYKAYCFIIKKFSTNPYYS